MKNKLLTKKVLCSVLAASLFGTCGAVFAAESTDNDLVIKEQIRVNNSTGDITYSDKDSLTVIDVEDVMYQGALQAENDKTITISNVGTVNIGTAENRLEGAAIHAQSGFVDIKSIDDVNIYAGNNGILGQYASEKNAVNIEAGGNITIDSNAYAVMAATMTNGEGTATVNISAGDKVIINSKEYAVSVYDQDKNTSEWAGENAAQAIISGKNGVVINSETSAIYMNRSHSANDGILSITSEAGDVVIESAQDAIIMKKANVLEGSLLNADITGNNVSIASENGLAVKAQNGSLNVKADNTVDYNGGVWVQGDTVLETEAETVNFIGGDKDGIVAIRKDGEDGAVGGHVDVNAKTINISTEDEVSGAVWVQNGTQTETEDAPSGAASVRLTADNINVTAPKLGLVAFSNGQLNVDGNLVVNAKRAIDTRGNATININIDGIHKTVLNGDIVFETPNTPSNPQNSGNLINSNVNINFSGAESSFNGSAYKTYPESGVEGDYMIDHNDNNHYGNVKDFNLIFDNGAAWNMTNDSFVNDVTLSNGGVINVQENAERFNADEAEINDGVINLQGDKQEVNVGTLSGESATVNVASENNKMNITTSNAIDSLTVAASGNYAEQLVQNNVNESLQNLANQVVDSTGESEKSAATDLYVAETAVAGAITAEVGEDGNLLANTVNEKVNTSNDAISNMANIALMAWRAENNDMNKRLGELRDSKGEHGIWARMVRGEGTYESIKNQYNTYQLGYDEKLSTNPNWTVGAALSYTEGESSFNGGSGENKHTGFAVYGSYLNDDGSFIDLIAKYARLDHDFDVNGGAGSGDYDTNGYSVSAEYGKRFTQDNGMWIEPQVELTYGKIGSANYTTDNGVSVRQDGMDSLVGRVGFALGKDFKQGNAYVRASYLYDFDGETDMTFSKNGVTRGFEQDLGGGWWEVGVGTNINLSDATHLYMDVEKTYGGDVATPWQWNVGVRYSF